MEINHSARKEDAMFVVTDECRQSIKRQLEFQYRARCYREGYEPMMNAEDRVNIEEETRAVVAMVHAREALEALIEVGDDTGIPEDPEGLESMRASLQRQIEAMLIPQS
jgi:hypothetical protein